MKDLNNGHTEVIITKKWFDVLKETYEPDGYYDFFNDDKVNNMYNSLIQEQSNKNQGLKDIELNDLVEGEIGYIRIPQMISANGSIDDDMRRIKTYLKEIQEYKSLVIDIRGNRGGADAYWERLVSLLSDKTYIGGGYRLYRNTSEVINSYTKYLDIWLNDINKLPQKVIKNAPEEVMAMFTHFQYVEQIVRGESNTPFKGNIYLFVDDEVFSGAESFAIFCKEQNFATIVGTKTRGDGYVLDPVLFKLNNSALIVRMSTAMYLTKSGICNEEEKTLPDIEIKNSSGDTRLELDNYVNKILELSNE